MTEFHMCPRCSAPTTFPLLPGDAERFPKAQVFHGKCALAIHPHPFSATFEDTVHFKAKS